MKVIRKELEISGIQDVRSKYKQNWINHRMMHGHMNLKFGSTISKEWTTDF